MLLPHERNASVCELHREQVRQLQCQQCYLPQPSLQGPYCKFYMSGSKVRKHADFVPTITMLSAPDFRRLTSGVWALQTQRQIRLTGEHLCGGALETDVHGHDGQPVGSAGGATHDRPQVGLSVVETGELAHFLGV